MEGVYVYKDIETSAFFPHSKLFLFIFLMGEGSWQWGCSYKCEVLKLLWKFVSTANSRPLFSKQKVNIIQWKIYETKHQPHEVATKVLAKPFDLS